MLLSSHRHRQDDLTLWLEMEAADRAHGERMTKQQEAIDAMREYARSRCYVSTSWGKDSVVVCHLAVLAGLCVPVVHIRIEGPQRDPEQDRVRDAFLARFAIDYHEIAVHPLEKKQQDHQHAPQLDEGIRRAREKFGSRWIGGLRAEESGARRIRARLPDSTVSSWPLKWWSVADVFGWLAVHDLPVHPAYAMLGGGRWQREQIRVSLIGGRKGEQFGRAEWEREYYGDVLRRLEARELNPQRS